MHSHAADSNGPNGDLSNGNGHHIPASSATNNVAGVQTQVTLADKVIASKSKHLWRHQALTFHQSLVQTEASGWALLNAASSMAHVQSTRSTSQSRVKTSFKFRNAFKVAFAR